VNHVGVGANDARAGIAQCLRLGNTTGLAGKTFQLYRLGLRVLRGSVQAVAGSCLYRLSTPGILYRLSLATSAGLNRSLRALVAIQRRQGLCA